MRENVLKRVQNMRRLARLWTTMLREKWNSSMINYVSFWWCRYRQISSLVKVLDNYDKSSGKMQNMTIKSHHLLKDVLQKRINKWGFKLWHAKHGKIQ